MNQAPPQIPRIAVLMGLAAGTPSGLVNRALRSTASSLLPEDRFFVLIDGGPEPAGNALHEAAAPVPVRVFSSPERRGLAAGLNRLVDEALREPEWALLARMDADDASLPGRMSLQRQFFGEHPGVDILGGGCREVDEEGRLLQTKTMPTTHEAIVAALPRRNPMNHPTVMMRRRVFEGGLRYRADVGLIEDYFLWTDAAAAGFRFANLGVPLLDFRRDRQFFRRRSGWRQACADFAARWHAIRALGGRVPRAPDLCWAAAGFGLRLLPASAQEALYRRLR